MSAQRHNTHTNTSSCLVDDNPNPPPSLLALSHECHGSKLVKMIPSQTAGQCWTCRCERTAAKYNCYDCCVMICFTCPSWKEPCDDQSECWLVRLYWDRLKTIQKLFRRDQQKKSDLDSSLLYEIIFFDGAVTCHTGNTVTRTPLLSTDQYACDFIINDFYQTRDCDYYIIT